MVETAAHLVDTVLPRVGYRQWVVSVPKRVRWYLKHEPAALDGLAAVFLRLVENALRRASPGAPRGARFGAVLFVHRFGDSLNSHVHFHVLVTDGVFSADPAIPAQAIFHPAVDLDDTAIRNVCAGLRRRGLRWLSRHGYLDPVAAADMGEWEHGGGWSVVARSGPVRVRRGGEVLAPGDGQAAVHFVDGRDLATFEVRCMEQGTGGTFNVVGPHPRQPLTMRRYLETCREVGGADATLVWVDQSFLEEHEVAPWSHLPCWLPPTGDHAGFAKRNVDRAVAAGLTFRPLVETIRDTLTWYDGLPPATQERIRTRTGLPAEREQAVLAAWSARR